MRIDEKAIDFSKMLQSHNPDKIDKLFDLVNDIFEMDQSPYMVDKSTGNLCMTENKKSDPLYDPGEPDESDLCEEEEYGGEKHEVLSNTVLLPLYDVIHHDLESDDTQLVLTAIRNSEIQKTVTIQPSMIFNRNWLINQWGSKTMIGLQKGAFNNTVRSMQSICMHVPTLHTYSYIGWLQDQPMTYLHSGGFIGNPVDNVTVDKSFSDFNLKVADISEEKAALFVINSVMKIAKKHISWTGVSYNFLSLHTSHFKGKTFKPEFSRYEIGESGSLKTSLAKIHFNFHEEYLERVPIQLDNCTLPAMEETGVRFRDCCCLFDDVSPSFYTSDKIALEAKVENLIRSYGDGNGRHKMASFGKKVEMKPNGLAVITAEHMVVKRTSSLARILIVNCSRDSIDLKLLTKVQSKRLHYPTAIKYYIQYIADNGENYINDYMDNFTKNRKRFEAGTDNIHGRLIQMAAWLHTSLMTYLKYAQSVITNKRINFNIDKYDSENFQMLLSLIKEQQQLITQDKEVALFITSVKEMIVTKKIQLIGVTVSGRKRQVDQDFADKNIAGFVDSEYVFFLPDTIYSMVCSYYTRLGRTFPVSLSSLMDSLYNAKLLIKDDNKDNTKTVRVTLNGSRVKVIRVDKDLFDKWDYTDKEEDENVF